MILVVPQRMITITRMAAVALVAVALAPAALAPAATLEAMTMTAAMVAPTVQTSRLEDPQMKATNTLQQPSAQCRMLLVEFSLLACSHLS
jgi:hypothetical protein